MFEKIKEEYLQCDVVFSEFLRSKIYDDNIKITKEQIQELLDWSGDSEFVTVDDILERG